MDYTETPEWAAALADYAALWERLDTFIDEEDALGIRDTGSDLYAVQSRMTEIKNTVWE